MGKSPVKDRPSPAGGKSADSAKHIKARAADSGSTDYVEPRMVLVPAAERTLRIFEAFERSAQPLTLSRLAEEIDVPISSCHNLVRTLAGRGYLFSLETNRTFYPTRKLWEVSKNIIEHDPILQRIQGKVETLRDVTTETVIVGKRQDQIAIYLLVLEGLHTIRYVAHPGRTIPLHTSAIGKALLSTLDEEQLERWLKSSKLEKVTERSISDRTELRKDIRIGKGRGYFETAGENVDDVGALAMPIRIGGETLSIAVAGPVARMEANRSTLIDSMTTVLKDMQTSL